MDKIYYTIIFTLLLLFDAYQQSAKIKIDQTAYVKGRAVADNLRSLMFLKDHCVEEKVDAVLVSLDAKKGIWLSWSRVSWKNAKEMYLAQYVAVFDFLCDGNEGKKFCM